MSHREIQMDKEKYEALKVAYTQAVADKKYSFMLDDEKFVTTVAKYALELLKPIYDRDINLS